MQVPARENFQVNLKAVLEREGFTQYQLADWSGVSRAFINKILLGTAEPSITTCEKIAKAIKQHLAVMILEPGTFKRLLESGSLERLAPVKDGTLLERELATKLKPPGLRRQSPKKTPETPENVRLRQWIKQLAS